jgi:hypothetical protein
VCVILNLPFRWPVFALAGVLFVLVAVALFFLLKQDDLGLRQTPGVADVEVAVQPLWSSRHLIHVLDIPFVPPARDKGTVPFEKYLRDAEAVQAEQMTLLRWLVGRFRLRAAYIAGVTPDGVPEFHAKVAELAAKQRIDVPALRKQLADAAASKTEKARQAERELGAQLEAQRERMLGIGAAGRLLMAEELSEVRALDAPGTPPDIDLRKSSPSERKARDEAIARNALRGGEPVVVVILGADHDLSDGLRETAPRCAYVRVTTHKVRELLGGR